MKLVVGNPPRPVLDALARGCGCDLLHCGDHSKGRAHQRAVPHAVYELPIAKLATGEWVGAARLAAWSFLVRRCSDSAWRLANVPTPRGRPKPVVSLSDALVDPFLESLAAAEEMERLGRFEIRRVVCTPVGLAALWLKNLGAGPDAFFEVGSRTTSDPASSWRVRACRHLLAKAEQAAART